MRPRKPTHAELTERLARAERENHLFHMGLIRSLTDTPDYTARFTYDGFRYTLRAFRLVGPHGGIVVMRARYLHGQQTDSVTVCYVDELSERFPLSAHDAHSAITTIKIARQRLYDAERTA